MDEIEIKRLSCESAKSFRAAVFCVAALAAVLLLNDPVVLPMF